MFDSLSPIKLFKNVFNVVSTSDSFSVTMTCLTFFTSFCACFFIHRFFILMKFSDSCDSGGESMGAVLDITKKLSHNFSLHFWIDMDSYDQHAKYLVRFRSFYKTLWIKKIQRGNPYKKKCFIEAPEPHPDILNGGHRNLYQLENAIKSGGTVFSYFTWAK